MARNSNSRKTAQLGAVGEAVYGHASARALLDADTFARVINDWKQLADCARHQLEVLNDLNSTLRKEIARLAEKEAQARHSAYHDWLTGLPNRSLLQDRFRQARSQAKRHHKPLALLLLDLDQFKHINDELGHASGDKLLRKVAHRMTKAIRGADTACRYGGDEFAIMLPVIENPGIATTLAAEIGKRLCEPYRIDGHLIQMSVSIGVAVYPGDGQTFDHLMKQADNAMYHAKRAGRESDNTGETQETPARVEWPNPSAIVKTDRLRKQSAFIQSEPVNIHPQPKEH